MKKLLLVLAGVFLLGCGNMDDRVGDLERSHKKVLINQQSMKRDITTFWSHLVISEPEKIYYNLAKMDKIQQLLLDHLDLEYIKKTECDKLVKKEPGK